MSQTTAWNHDHFEATTISRTQVGSRWRCARSVTFKKREDLLWSARRRNVMSTLRPPLRQASHGSSGAALRSRQSSDFQTPEICCALFSVANPSQQPACMLAVQLRKLISKYRYSLLLSIFLGGRDLRFTATRTVYHLRPWNWHAPCLICCPMGFPARNDGSGRRRYLLGLSPRTGASETTRS